MAGCRSRTTRIFWMAGVIILIITAVVAPSLLREGFRKVSDESSALSDTKPYQEIEGLTLTEYCMGKEKMVINAQKASIRPKRIGFLTTSLIKEAHMVKPDILIYKESGSELASRITADNAIMDISNKNMDLRDNIVVATSDGRRLTTSKLIFSPQKGIISTKERFTLSNKGDSVEGKGFNSDVELKNFN